VLAWGAVDAHHPSRDVAQVRFQFDYAGGWRKYRREVWRGFRDACRPYDGPELVYLVAACKAPDELHLSHWTGPLAVLEVSPNWTYGGAFQGLFGRLLYRDVPVHGFRTPSTTRKDGYARFVYIDTYNSVYGHGWKREAAKVTHIAGGGFCFSFVPQKPPPGYPSDGVRVRGPGVGERHRVTVMGPGVTPVVQWEGRALGRFDPGRDAEFNRLFSRLLGGDGACASER
jgi:hypothetical protein